MAVPVLFRCPNRSKTVSANWRSIWNTYEAPHGTHMELIMDIQMKLHMEPIWSSIWSCTWAPYGAPCGLHMEPNLA